ncbi:hypothetical protein GCM10010140_72870 [Streptosporangium pseudovulgare]|uniref:Uncharacterized protein n=1 Tax=Streptosporangium pseudovulgare TaxID=35765 RepID=A0ABQ2RH99_9ACTN|nr:hypothetical protein GCM10010140_72870 [Streptosporangium pseudovulgare]
MVCRPAAARPDRRIRLPEADERPGARAAHNDVPKSTVIAKAALAVPMTTVTEITMAAALSLPACFTAAHRPPG